MVPPPKPRKGRGALSNPEGRFESRRVQPVDDGWALDSEMEPPSPATTVSAEHARSIISRNDSPDIPFEQSINPYRGCGHACCYCLSGDTQILMVSGQAKRLGDLQIGDEIVGTHGHGQDRRYVRTRVLAHWETYKPAYRVMLADGTAVIASADHRFLTDRGWKFVREADQGRQRRPHLTTGNSLVGIGTSTGTIAPPCQFRLALAGGPGVLHSGSYLEEFGVQTGVFLSQTATATAKKADAISAWSRSTFRAMEKLTAWCGCAPADWIRDVPGGPRSLHRVESALARKRAIFGLGVQSQAALAIVEIEPLGVSMPMYDITTGTGDFIANGVVSHNCYARPAHSYVNLSPGLDFETKLFYKDNAAELLEEELRRPRYVCKPINLGANTDPYQPIERTLKVTRSILEVLQRFRHPVTIVTKGHLIERDIDILAEMARDNLAAVHVSVTTLDPDLKRILEPRAPSAAARLHAIRCLHDAGIPVGTLVAPVIPAINDHEIEHILAAVAQAGSRTAAYVMLRLPYEVKDLFREWLSAHYPLRAAHVMSLVNDLRGGRDNDPNFGSRMRGTGPFADLVRRRFEVACRNVNLNTVRRVLLNTRLFQSPLPPGAQLGLGF